MASGPKPLNIENPKGWAVQPIEGGTHTAVIFDMRDGPFGVALNNNDLSRFTERILHEMAKLTATQRPKFPPQTLASNPVPVSSIGLASYPQDSSSAILALSIGDFQISFQVDASMLLDMCQKVLASTTVVKPRTTN